MPPIGDLMDQEPANHLTIQNSPNADQPDFRSEALVNCEICGDMGWVTKNVPTDHPDFGKAFPCVCQQGTIASRQFDRALKLSNLDAYRHMRFENFEVDIAGMTASQQQNLQTVLSMAIQFVERLEKNWLVLEGSYGTGKTHLAASIGNYLVEQGYNVIFMTVPDLLDHLRTTFSPTSDVRYDELFEMIKTAEVLILDDLGTEAPSHWAGEKLFQLLNYRYVAQLPTVITSNHRIDDLDGRISSRLQDRSFVWRSSLNGPDYRKARQIGEQNINERMYGGMHFDNFDVYTENLQRARHYAREFANNPTNRWLVLHGKHGCGKTHLAAAVVNWRRQHGEPVMFITAPDLLDFLRDAFKNQSETVNQRLQQLREARLLVIDALTSRMSSAWSDEKIFQVIDYRYHTRKPLLITATTDELNKLGERYGSRFSDTRVCTVFHIDAPGYYERTHGNSAPRRKR